MNLPTNVPQENAKPELLPLRHGSPEPVARFALIVTRKSARPD